MNKKITLLGLSAFAAAVSLSSCTTVGEHKSSAELYYTNMTQADLVEYRFLRTVYQLSNDEIAFAQLIDQKGSSANVKALAKKVSEQLQEVQTKLAEMGEKADVLIPQPGLANFELPHGLDSAQGPALEKAYIQHSLHNQEVILHQFMNVEENTKRTTRDFAEETIPTLEETLKETKALL